MAKMSIAAFYPRKNLKASNTRKTGQTMAFRAPNMPNQNDDAEPMKYIAAPIMPNP